MAKKKAKTKRRKPRIIGRDFDVDDDRLYGPALTAARFILRDGSVIRAEINADETGIRLCSVEPVSATAVPAFLCIKPECANVITVRTESALVPID